MLFLFFSVLLARGLTLLHDLCVVTLFNHVLSHLALFISTYYRRNNVDLRRTITHVEGKLTGQAQETAALEGCMRSQPSIGKKRKRDSDGAVPNGQAATTEPLSTSLS